MSDDYATSKSTQLSMKAELLEFAIRYASNVVYEILIITEPFETKHKFLSFDGIEMDSCLRDVKYIISYLISTKRNNKFLGSCLRDVKLWVIIQIEKAIDNPIDSLLFF